MILKDNKARGLLIGILLSSIGMGVHILALGQLLFNLTGSPKALATILALQGVGAICILVVSGPMVDALSSKHIYVACDIARSATVLLIVGITMLPISNPIPYIIWAAVFLAIFDNIQRSALFKFCAHHIVGDNLLEFNSLIGVAVQVGTLGGMSLLGLILIKGTTSQALLVDVITAALSAGVVGSIRLQKRENPHALSFVSLKKAVVGVISDWWGLLARFKQEPVVIGMLILCASDFVLSYCFSMLVVPLVDRFYMKQSWWMALFEATFAIGMICASFATRVTSHQILLPVWLSIQAVAALLLANSALPVAHFTAFFAAGFANLNSLTWLLTVLQQNASETDKAKMASLRLFSIGLGTALILPLVGHLATTSLTSAYTGLTLIMFAFAVCGTWVALTFRQSRCIVDEK